MNLWRQFLRVAAAVGGLLVPPLARATDVSTWGRRAHALGHLAVCAVLFASLAALNWFLLDITSWLGPRAPWPILGKIWLPLLALWIYAVVMIVWWLRRKARLLPNRFQSLAVGYFWESALQSEAGRRSLREDAAIFLVIGKGTAFSALYQGAKLGRGLERLDSGERNSPIQVLSDGERFFVIFPGTLELVRAAKNADASDGVEDSERELRAIRESRQDLTHLCELIAESRRDYCPINGILLLSPFTALKSDVETSRAIRFFRHDLDIVRSRIAAACPLFAVITDLGQIYGCRDLLSHLTEAAQRGGLGFTLPYVPDATSNLVRGWIREGVDDLVFRELRYLANAALRDRGFQDTPFESLQAAAPIEEFTLHVASCRDRIARLLCGILSPLHRQPHLPGGAFLATSGAGEEEATLARPLFAGDGGLFLKQNATEWTPRARRRDRGRHLAATVCYAALAASIAAGLVIAAWCYPRERNVKIVIRKDPGIGAAQVFIDPTDNAGGNGEATTVDRELDRRLRIGRRRIRVRADKADEYDQWVTIEPQSGTQIVPVSLRRRDSRLRLRLQEVVDSSFKSQYETNHLLIALDGNRISESEKHDLLQGKLWSLPPGEHSLGIYGLETVDEHVSFSVERGKEHTASVVLRGQPNPLRTLEGARGHISRINAVAFLPRPGAGTNNVARPDYNQAVTASDDGTVIVWDTRSGQPLAILPGGSRIAAMAAAGDGKHIVYAFDNIVRLWQVEKNLAEPANIGAESAPELSDQGGKEHEDHERFVRCLAYAADRTEGVRGLALSGADDGLHLWHVDDATTAAESFDNPQAGTAIYCVAFANDKNTIFFGGAGFHSVGLSGDRGKFEAASHKMHQLLPPPSADDAAAGAKFDVRQIVPCRVDTQLLILAHPAGDSAGPLSLFCLPRWDQAAAIQVTVPNFTPSCAAVDLTKSDPTALIGTEQGALLYWDTKENQAYVLHEQAHNGTPITAVAISTTGRYGISGGEDGTVKIWRLNRVYDSRSARVDYQREIEIGGVSWRN